MGVETQIVLLRGINVGSRNRIKMPELRAALSDAGFENVRTYVQSGNVLLDSALSPDALSDRFSELLRRRFDLDVPVVTRTAEDLKAVVELDPLKDVVTEPKRYQVSFLSAEPDPDVVAALADRATEDEAFAVHGRELYGWHPGGIHSSKLAGAMGDPKRLGMTVTARNWSTVTTLLEMGLR